MLARLFLLGLFLPLLLVASALAAGGGPPVTCQNTDLLDVGITGPNPTVEVGQGSTAIECYFLSGEPETCELRLQHDVSPGVWALLSTSSQNVGCPLNDPSCFSETEVSPSSSVSFNWACTAPGTDDVRCFFSEAGNLYSTPRTVTCVDTTPPFIELIDPLSGLVLDDDYVYFCNVSDNWNIDNVSLVFDFGSGPEVVMNYTGIDASVFDAYFNVTYLPSGTHSFWCESFDDEGNKGVSPSRIVTVAPVTPTGELFEPFGTYGVSTIPYTFTKTNVDLCEVSWSNLSFTSVTQCNNLSFNFGVDGTHQFRLRLSNGAESIILNSTFTLVNMTNYGTADYVFQEGYNGYVGQENLDLAEGEPDISHTFSYMQPKFQTNFSISSLLKFDLSSIPAGSTIDSAFLKLNLVNQNSNDLSMYPVLKDWSRPGGTWNCVDDVANDGCSGGETPWDIPGAKASTDRDNSKGINFSVSPSWNIINVTGLVRDWVTFGVPNYGVVIESDFNYNDRLAGGQYWVTQVRPILEVNISSPVQCGPYDSATNGFIDWMEASAAISDWYSGGILYPLIHTVLSDYISDSCSQ